MNVDMVIVTWKGSSKIVPPYGLLETDRALSMTEDEANNFKERNPPGTVIIGDEFNLFSEQENQQ